MKSVLLTGSEGRLATSVIIPLLRELDYEVIHFDKVLGDDVLDLNLINRKLPKGTDIVIHTAAIAGPTKTDKKELFDLVNFQGSKNMMDVSSEKKIKKFIFFSSFSYYGVDAWMRYREETGAVAGEDLAVPRYLPIDEEHPSIMEYDLDKLTNYNGKYYGLSKAKVEKYARDNAGYNSFSFISMRLAGFARKTEKYAKRKKEFFKNAKRGIADIRKQHLYGLADITTPSIFKSALEAVLTGEFDQYDAYNVCEPNSGLSRVVKTYFPDLYTTDRIFTNQKILRLINRYNIQFSPEPEFKRIKKLITLFKKTRPSLL